MKTKKDYILSLSYGKDSLACLGAIKKLGLPLTRIVHAEIWATDTIHADLPPMIDFKRKADKFIYQEFGMVVEHICATSVDGVKKEKVSYQDVFYKKKERGKYVGNIHGFPMVKGQWCQKLKLNAIANICSVEDVNYLGIASDEPKRIASHQDKPNIMLPLVMAGWDEAFCRMWCQERDLLSPIYSNSSRGGCWFCHYQSVDQLRHLRNNYPEYWALMLEWDKDSPNIFNKCHTVHEYEARFQLEDEGAISARDKWWWGYLKDTPLQLKLDI